MNRHFTNLTLLWSLFVSSMSNGTTSLPPLPSMTRSNIVWEFESGLEGWRYILPDKTPSISRLQHTGSWMTVHFQDDRGSFLESPAMNLQYFYVWPYTPPSVDVDHEDEDEDSVQDKQKWTLVFRYRFVGPNQSFRVVLKGNLEILKDDPLVVNSSFSSYQSHHHHASSDITTFLKEFNVYLIGDGSWQISYLALEIFDPINLYSAPKTLTLHNICIHPYPIPKTSPFNNFTSIELSRLKFDWIRLLHAPLIMRVTGCSANQYSQTLSFTNNVTYDMAMSTMKLDDVSHRVQTTWNRYDLKEYPYARTFNCNRNGGENITIEGFHFSMMVGPNDNLLSPAHVLIDDTPCTHVRHDPLNPDGKITCITPIMNIDRSSTSIKYAFDSRIQVRNGKLPGLSDTSVSSLRYANPPPTPVDIQLFNFAARSIDVSWKPGGAFHTHITYTGFVIYWREFKANEWSHSMVVGNISTTSIRGLTQSSMYCVGISGLTENQRNNSWWADLDVYGRRMKVSEALEGPISHPECGLTLDSDLEFSFFNANQTRDHGPADTRAKLGPTAVSSGKGHYGLRLVGSATIENCNASSFCCDEYTFDGSSMGCGSRCMTCRVPIFWDYYTEDAERYYPGPGIVLEPFLSGNGSFSFHSQCGPAIRLTGSFRNQRGAMWYARQMEVLEGFDTTFTFRISTPSTRCRNLHEIYDYCRSRGSDGIAFVIQTDGLEAIGGLGHDLGYSGMNNYIAIEFDTFYNFEDEDEPYENHISVKISRNHMGDNSSASLGDTSNIPDLTIGNINIRIIYEPIFDESQLSKPSFIAPPILSKLLIPHNPIDDRELNSPQWNGKHLGLLKVFCQSFHEPVLIVPLDLGGTLNLHRGRAWVGFTASTGQDTWQTHDILKWAFRSLRMDTHK